MAGSNYDGFIFEFDLSNGSNIVSKQSYCNHNITDNIRIYNYKKIFSKINNTNKDKKSGFYYDELTNNKDIVDSVLSTYNQTVKNFIQNHRIYSGLEIDSWREIIELELDDFDFSKHSFL